MNMFCNTIFCNNSGLVEELLNRLSNAAGPQANIGASSVVHGEASGGVGGTSSSGSAGGVGATGNSNIGGSVGANATAAKAPSTDANRSSQSISTTISLLSTLCRGSPSITHDLLRSNLRTAMERALKGDERCILDCMRLADLILLLLFEGREALNRVACVQGQLVPRVRRTDSSSERTHRQLIDCIRSKDSDALIEAIESGGIDVNCMDDVGQTLLNWASAFGTLEMVEYLCDKGADVNKGQRSSSLHYAACFGRPGIAKVLLKHGANPDLRDEDGKTPLDKARERIDEGHREVASILQSPGEWMSAGRLRPLAAVAGQSAVDVAMEATEEGVAAAAAAGNSSTAAAATDAESAGGAGAAGAAAAAAAAAAASVAGPRGDPEMSPVYLKFFLPAFCRSFQSTMLSSVRRSSLGAQIRGFFII